ncbi:phospho-N-acetylmuramoyl-pentapeptide-transferase, partial [Candidatus Omnitrophota bacterium]
IISSILLSSLLWSRLDNIFIWLSLGVLVWFGLLGFFDDYAKFKRKKGLGRRFRLVIQLIGGAAVGVVILVFKPIDSCIYFPLFKDAVVNLGCFYILWTALVISAGCNSVNFTDGLDGLAIGSILMVSLVFSVFSYLSGNFEFSRYLLFPFVKGAGELTVFCSCILGSGLGFLWFNAQPAEVFMGDVGSSALGACLGAIAVFTKKELWLFIAGGLFVIEALSVILQIASVKIFKRKLFKAAPFHHHLQLLGWPESKITVRLWILSSLFAALALATLKIR